MTIITKEMLYSDGLYSDLDNLSALLLIALARGLLPAEFQAEFIGLIQRTKMSQELTPMAKDQKLRELSIRVIRQELSRDVMAWDAKI